MLSAARKLLPSMAPLNVRVSSSRMLSTPAPKQFQDIPGPKGYPLVGTALDYRNDKFTMFRVLKKRLEKYGPLYREKLFPGMPEQVVVFMPDDIETVFRSDSDWPNRPEGGEITKKLFKDSGIKDIGILSAQGEQWHKMRSPMSKFIMVPRKVAEYHEDFNNITLDLIKNIEMKKDSHSALLSDVPSLLFNWSFESVAFFSLGKRLGALTASGETSPESQEFIKYVGKLFNDITEVLFAVPLYLIYPTKGWKHIVNVNKTVHKLARQFIDEKLAEIAEDDRRALEAVSGEEEAPDKVDFITYLIHSGKMSVEEVSVNVVDLLSAGVETTSYTLSWALYSLASNPEAQEKLRNEIQSVVGSDKIVTPAHINQMSYLRSTVKETERLYPVAVFNQRVLQQDIVLSGYAVPKGTEVLLPQILIGRMPELFSEPDKFSPERWSKENKDSLPSMFAHLPFGFGARMCVGRRLAELELHIALAHLIREYKVDCLDKEPIGYVMKALLKPDKQLNLTFNKI